MTAVLDALEIIGAYLRRLDRRRHALPARLELSQEENRWTAMIMADSLPLPLTAHGHAPAAAVQELADAIVKIDRRVRSRVRA